MTSPKSHVQRTTCRYCKGPLARTLPETLWLDAWGGRECEKAPNPDEGPMPNHEPGTPILDPPVFDGRLTAPPATVIPFIPGSRL